MAAPKALILTGYGINCEEETKYAFEKAGANAEIVHVNDLIAGNRKLQDYRILAFPGGFSYGDDTGSGNALANRIRNHLWKSVEKFVEEENLVIGICNGFQVMVNLGLLPALDKEYGKRQAALVHNDNANYIDRWVDLKFSGKSPWAKGLNTISIPIAHGEGKFFAPQEILEKINSLDLVAAKYVEGEACKYQNMKANPNGALENIASITDVSGRLIGMMPHPERAMFFTQLPNWPLLKEKLIREGKEIPKEGPGLKVFRNAVEYF